MPTINPYLNFAGNAEEAFNFYKSVFGGEFLALQRFKDTPEAGKIPKHEQNKIMHVALPIGKGNILMATGCFLGCILRHVQRQVWDSVDDQLRHQQQAA